MFQLALTDKLRSHLSAVSSRGASDAQQPVLHDAGKRRMQQLPGYDKTGAADNARVFHGREVRQGHSAAGAVECTRRGLASQTSQRGIGCGPSCQSSSTHRFWDTWKALAQWTQHSK